MKSSGSLVFAATAALFGLFAGHVQAQNSTSSEDIEGPVVQVFFVTTQTLSLRHLEQFKLAGSIQEANPSMTVLALECVGDNVDPEMCGTAPQTITFAPTTWIGEESVGNIRGAVDCSIASNSASAYCEALLEGPVELFTNPTMAESDISFVVTASGEELTSTTLSVTLASTDFTFLPVTITAGQELLEEDGGDSETSGSTSASETTGSEAGETSGTETETGTAGAASETTGSGSTGEAGNGAGKATVAVSGLMALVLGVTMMVL